MAMMCREHRTVVRAVENTWDVVDGWKYQVHKDVQKQLTFFFFFFFPFVNRASTALTIRKVQPGMLQ